MLTFSATFWFENNYLKPPATDKFIQLFEGAPNTKYGKNPSDLGKIPNMVHIGEGNASYVNSLFLLEITKNSLCVGRLKSKNLLERALVCGVFDK